MYRLVLSHWEYRDIRRKLGSQELVAAHLGVARSTVAHRERGKMVITPEAAYALIWLSKRGEALRWE